MNKVRIRNDFTINSEKQKAGKHVLDRTQHVRPMPQNGVDRTNVQYNSVGKTE